MYDSTPSGSYFICIHLGYNHLTPLGSVVGFLIPKGLNGYGK